MNKQLTWQKDLLSNAYEIYANGEQVGCLKDQPFTRSGLGILNDKEFLFQTKGFLNKKTQIIDSLTNKSIGEIQHSNWLPKATIGTQERSVNWNYDNAGNTKWSISNPGGLHIAYTGSSRKGQIVSNTEDPLFLLSGLFISNYYWQLAFAIM